MKNKKKLLGVCIFLITIATISCSKELDKKELHITEDVFTVGEGLEVRVSIFDKTEPSEYTEHLTFFREFEGAVVNDEIEFFKIDLTISNTSQTTIVLYSIYFGIENHIPFVNSSGEVLRYRTRSISCGDLNISLNHLLFLEPDESVTHSATYEYYRDDSQEKVIASSETEYFFNEDDQIYCVIKYNPSNYNIEKIKALTNEDLPEPFEKKYLLELDF